MSDLDYEQHLEWLQLQDGSTLLKVQKDISRLLEKFVKNDRKSGPEKGVAPPQLAKASAWVDFTERHAMKNGWEEFVLKDTKKVDGEKVEEYVTMPGSIMQDGAYFFAGSITEKNPVGKQFNKKHAMALSKQRWAPKDKSGTHEELYEEFLEEYTENLEEEKFEKVTKVLKMTAEEKEAFKKEEEARKELKKAEAKKDEKAKKEAEKAKKEAEKLAEKNKAAASKIVRADEVDEKLKKKKVEKVEKVEKMEKWSCPDDGKCHPWVFKGQKLFRNYENGVYKQTPSGLPLWLGVYMEADDKIDDSVEDPNEDEEDEY